MDAATANPPRRIVLDGQKNHSLPKAEPSDCGLIIATIQGEIIEANETFANIFGRTKESLEGQSLSEWLGRIIDSDRVSIETFLEKRRTFESWRCKLIQDSQNPALHSWVEIQKTHAGSQIVICLQNTLPPLNELQENSIVELGNSIGGREQLVARLIELESRLLNIHERWPGIVFTQRSNMTFREISPKVQELTGYGPSDLDKKPGAFWEFVHESDHEELKKNLASLRNNPRGVDSTFRIKNQTTGKISYILEHRISVYRGGLLVSYHGVWIDITRQMIAEKRLMGSAWKETLAVLTMGLAHDFRNTMAGIASLSDTLMCDPQQDDSNKEYLEDIRKNSMHANQLVQKILDLHQGKTGDAQYENLNDLASDIGELVRKITPRRIEFTTSIAPSKLTIWVDPVEFRQVIVNLALNAVDAIEKNGEISFSNGIFEGDEFPSHTFGITPRTPCAYIAISDSGCGIEQAKLSKIFEPFFTSKAMNKGSGLGLYNTKIFVERHNGAISVESKRDSGTKFTIFLPLQNLDSLSSPDTGGEDTQILRAYAGELNKTDHSTKPNPGILIAGNPGQSLESAAEFLKAQGFNVSEVVQKSQAMDLLEQKPEEFRVLLVIIEDGCDEWLSYIDELRMAHEDISIVLKLQNCDQDTLRDSEIEMASWIISPATSRMEVLDKLSQMMEVSGG